MAKYKFYDGSSWVELFPASGGNITGHVYLTGATTTSTGNTTQIVFGTSSSQSVAISSNPNGLIINPSTSSTAGQICLWVGATPYIQIDGQTVATQAYVDNAIDSLPQPMIFKGTVGTNGTVSWANLPNAGSTNVGWTYKVITTNDNMQVKVGDTIISDGTDWIKIPSGDEPNGTVTNVATGNGLTGGPITSSGTISLASAYGDTVNPYGSKTANYVLAAPNGSDGVPTFRALVAADFPNGVTLDTNQEITGNKRFTGDVTVGEGYFYIENDDNNYKTEIKQVSGMTGNRILQLPNKDGILAVTNDIPTVTNYYWADISVSSSSSKGTSPTVSKITVGGSGSTAGKATMQYNATDDCVEFVFAS